MQSSLTLFESGFSIPSITMSPFWRIRFNGPIEDLDRIFDELIKIHDSPLFPPHIQQKIPNQPLGSRCLLVCEVLDHGAETNTRKRPNIVEMSLTMAKNGRCLHILKANLKCLIKRQKVMYALEALEKRIFVATYKTMLPSDARVKKAIKMLNIDQ